MTKLSGQTVLITGAAQGIGLALSEVCAGEDMKIIMSDIDSALLESSANAVRKMGGSITTIKMDVTKPDDWARAKSKITKELGGLDILINNAGLLGTPARSWEVEPEEWERVFNLNLYGMIHGIRAFVPDMIARGSRAHIVNLSSVAGHTVQPFTGPYHVSKFGVTAVTESLVHEFDIIGADIGLTLVCPGFTKTNILNEKNLPSPLDNDPHMSFLRQAFIGGIGKGVAAIDVAKAAMDAVKDDRFYVFTSPGTLDYATERFEKISKLENPMLNVIMRERYLTKE